jgi:hypothetical protein
MKRIKFFFCTIAYNLRYKKSFQPTTGCCPHETACFIKPGPGMKSRNKKRPAQGTYRSKKNLGLKPTNRANRRPK